MPCASACVLLALAFSACVFAGCAAIKSAINKEVAKGKDKIGIGSGGSRPSVAAPVDEAPFAEFRWLYGDGFNGSPAVIDGAEIANLVMHPRRLTFDWLTDMSVWGFPNPDHAEVACLFIKRSDGIWVGGKFDWVRNSNGLRELHHLWPPDSGQIYRNWGGLDWSQVPNPCEVAFVVVEGNRNRRSNVISGTWRR